jgi:type II secretory pathway pseudopilin PulG
MNRLNINKQRGITLIGLIFVLAIVGIIGIIALKIVPTVLEFQAIKRSIVTARNGATTPRDIQVAFDKQANIGYIESISGKDLTILRNGNDFDVSFAYDKKIPLVGPASILLEYEGTTAAAEPAPGRKKTIE